MVVTQTGTEIMVVTRTGAEVVGEEGVGVIAVSMLYSQLMQGEYFITLRSFVLVYLCK